MLADRRLRDSEMCRQFSGHFKLRALREGEWSRQPFLAAVVVRSARLSLSYSRAKGPSATGVVTKRRIAAVCDHPKIGATNG
jgi:hypothetical protein